MNLIGALRFDDRLPGPVLRRFPHDGAILFFDAIENVRRVRAPAAIRENRVGQGEFGERDLTAAEKCRGERAQRRLDPGRLAELQHRIDADRHADADRRAVLRFRQRPARRHRSFIPVFLRLGSPFAENPSRAADHDRAIIERRIFDERSGKQSVFESGCVNERLDRGAGGTARLERAVVLVVLEIATADQNEDSRRLVIERDQRALQIIGRHTDVRDRELFGALITVRVDVVGRVTVAGVFLGFREMRSQRFLSDPLHFRIDRRVDPVTFIHRPVPADGGDDLLPDVIDGVGLALRALPAADRDLFRLRGFAAFAGDEPEIAHPRQGDIPRVA